MKTSESVAYKAGQNNTEFHETKYYTVEETKSYRSAIEYLKIIVQADKTSRDRGVVGVARRVFPKLIDNAISLVGSSGNISTLTLGEVNTLHRLCKDVGIFNASEMSRIIPLIRDLYKE